MGELAAGALALCSAACAGLAWTHVRRDRTLGVLDPRRPKLAANRRRWPRPPSSGWLLAPACLLCTVLCWRVAGMPGAAASVACSVVLPRVVARRRGERRREALEGSLADAVSSIGSALRAGMSLPQAVAHAGRETSPPLGSVLTRVADRSSLGVPLDRALAGWLDEVRTADVRLVVGALRLHQRTGGSLPSVLDELARTLRERRSGAREVRSLTAQARLSATILGLLPVGFFLFLSATSRSDIQAATHTPAGVTAIGFGLFLQGAAYLWIRHLLRVEP